MNKTRRRKAKRRRALARAEALAACLRREDAGADYRSFGIFGDPMTPLARLVMRRRLPRKAFRAALAPFRSYDVLSAPHEPPTGVERYCIVSRKEARRRGLIAGAYPLLRLSQMTWYNWLAP